MSIYNLRPITLKDEDGKRTVERELRSIGDAINNEVEKTAEMIAYAEPPGSGRAGNPLFGYEVYADGTTWNPDGSGAGWFKRGPTAWERMT